MKLARPARAGSCTLVLAGLLGLRCGSDSEGSSPPIDASTPDSALADECSLEVLAEPSIADTYYVAIEQPGADNAACDGRAPTDEGGGRCPFKDLGAVIARGLLAGTKSVRVELRAGTYIVDRWEGFEVHGAGTSESERVVLSSYRDEKPVFDVAIKDHASCAVDGATPPPGCVRQVVSVLGTYVVVQGLTIQNGLGYDLHVAGSKHLVRCNHITYTTPNTVGGTGRSDALKLVSGDTVVRHNEFTNWESQAVDTAGSRDPGLVVEENHFHDPHDRGCGAVGIKSGVRDIIVQKNVIHDIHGSSCTQRGVLGGGGDGAPRPDDYSAYRVQVRQNRVWNAKAMLATFSSCDSCAFEDNLASDILAGVVLRADLTGAPACSASTTGCKPTTKMRIVGNQLRNMLGDGTAGTANHFVVIESAAEATELTVAENTYCSNPTAADARFIWDFESLAFDAWSAASGDATSLPLAIDDPKCAPW